MNEIVAYVLQAVIAVSVNFYLNWRFTWSDRIANERKVRSFAHSALKFAGSRVITIALNSIAYTVLVHVFHVQYLIASIVLIAVFAVINYLVGHYWSFTTTQPTPTTNLLPHENGLTSTRPSVGIIVPVKRSHKSIRACVESLIQQDYAGAIKIVLVGDPGDSTWSAIDDYIASGAITVIEADIQSVRRDANAKRTIGLDSLDTDVLVLTDSDMILPEYWVTNAVGRIKEGWRCVAGPMQSINEGFWSRYIDKNPILAKTPRMASDYVVHKDNFGTTATPPITSGAAFTQEAYRLTGGLNPNFVYSYEDYEFFDRMAQADVQILCTPDLVGTHAHRENFKALLRDYYHTGFGAADFVHYNSASKMSRKRRAEVMGLTLGFLVVVPLVIAASIVLGITLIVALVLASFATAVSLYCWARVQHIHGIAFPAITFAFGIMSYLGFITRRRMIRREGMHQTLVLSTNTL